MYKTLKLTLSAFLAVAGLSGLVACDDELVSSNNSVFDVDVSDYKSLPSCKSRNDAERATVVGDSLVYVCVNGDWKILDSTVVAKDSVKALKSVPNCTESREGESYFVKNIGVTYVCQDGVWEIAALERPKSSSSAKVSPVAESSSEADVEESSSSEGLAESSSVAESSSDVEDLSSSSEAASSSSSAAVASSSSIPVEVSSSSEQSNVVAAFGDLPKCNMAYEDEVYLVTKESSSYICTSYPRWEKARYCDGEIYGEKSYFCKDKTIYSNVSYGECNGDLYKRDEEFCFKDKIYLRADYVICWGDDNEISDVAERGNQFCTNGVAYDNCGDKAYSVEYYLCYEGALYNKETFAVCSVGGLYSVATEKCTLDGVTLKCGETEYLKNATSVCVAGTYADMTEKLHVVSQYVGLTYYKDGDVSNESYGTGTGRTWNGQTGTESFEFAKLATALRDKGFVSTSRKTRVQTTYSFKLVETSTKGEKTYTDVYEVRVIANSNSGTVIVYATVANYSK